MNEQFGTIVVPTPAREGGLSLEGTCRYKRPTPHRRQNPRPTVRAHSPRSYDVASSRRNGTVDPLAGAPAPQRPDATQCQLLLIEKLQHGRNAGPVLFRASRYLDIIGTCLFEGQAHKLAPPLNGGPIVELISHRFLPSERLGQYRSSHE
jgi:hypothetical protein